MVKTIPIKRFYDSGDIYWCNLGSMKGVSTYDKTKLLKKVRPCLIISDIEFNTSMNGALILPIKTDHTKGIETNKFSKYRKFIHIEEDKKEPSSVVNDQIRFVSDEYIDRYYGTLTNEEKAKEIYSSLFNMSIDEKYKEDICLEYLLQKYDKKSLLDKIKNI